MTVRLMFGDGRTVEGDTFTAALEALLHGWNPASVPALKRTLAARSLVLTGHAPDPSLADDDFTRALDALGFWTLDED
jgi:hypothetical protein